MTRYLVLDKEDIEKINNDQLVILTDTDNVEIVICSEKAFEDHKQVFGLMKGEDLVNV